MTCHFNSFYMDLEVPVYYIVCYSIELVVMSNFLVLG